MTIDLLLSCPLHDSFRVQQVLGMFDLPPAETLRERFTVELPDEAEPWQIGVITGPSGSGKTSIARKAYGCNLYSATDWPTDRAVIDCFGDHPIRRITQTLCAVGFSSPPAWIKPFAVLSNGERFRCELARALLREEMDRPGLAGAKESRSAEAMGRKGDEARKNNQAIPASSPLPLFASALSAPILPSAHCPLPTAPVVFDEFTSLVDRTVAQITSAAVAKAIRGGKIPRRFVAVTCHQDIIPWLQPDWVLDMTTQTLSRRRLRRSVIRLAISRTDRNIWKIFQRHHYLSKGLHKAAQCYVGTVNYRPAVFCAVLPFPHPRRPGWREHRLVCLPDFQGVGIGSAMSAYIASVYVATRKPYFSRTGHPAVIHHRMRSPEWKLLKGPGLVSRMGKSAGETGMGDTLSAARITAGFEYVGPPGA